MRVGRIGFLVGLVPLGAAGAFTDAIASTRPFGLHPDLAAMVIPVVLLVAGVTLVAWRCHDFNRSIWLTFWTDQVPVIGPLWALYELVTKPGSIGINDYGSPPRL